MLKNLILIFSIALLLVSCEIKEDRYCFIANGVEICVGDDLYCVKDRLGEPNRERRASSCAGAGEDVVYIYDGFRISAYLDGERRDITSIELTSDAVSTPEGVSIGDSRDTVVSVYGAPRLQGVRDAEYECGGVRLRFSFSDGYVGSIKYLPCDG